MREKMNCNTWAGVEEGGEEKQAPAETGEPKDGEAVSGGVQNSKTADSG